MDLYITAENMRHYLGMTWCRGYDMSLLPQLNQVLGIILRTLI